MKTKTFIEKANAVKTRHQAAVLYNNIDMELSLGFYGEEDWERGDKAQRILEEKYPGVAIDARNIDTPPALSRNAAKGLAGGDTSLAGALAVDTSKLPTGRWVPLRPETAPLPPKPYRRHLRPLLATVLTVAAFGAMYGWFSMAPDPNGCPGNSSYSNSSLEEVCTNPSGNVTCVLSAFGFTPFKKDSQPAQVYARSGPDGPWCKNAHNPPAGV